MADLRRVPAGIAETARFSWILPSLANGQQSAFQVQAAARLEDLLAGRPDHDTGQTPGRVSASVVLSKRILERGRHCYWRVRTWDSVGHVSGWSTPQRVIAEAPEDWDADPIWIHESDSETHWLLARTEFEIPADVEAVWVHATGASPEPARQYVFRLTLNGAFVGVGPVRSYAPQQEERYSTFDLTDLVRPGKNALAALCYTTEGRLFLASLTIVRSNGERTVINTGPAWRVFSGDRWRPPAGFTGGGYFKAPEENIDARQEPVGWQLPGFDDRGWAIPEKRPFGLTLRPHSVDEITQTIVKPSAVQLSPGRWIFDLGREIVGGIRLTVSGKAGQTVEVRLGEERNADGSVRYELRAMQTYRELWTLRDGPQQLEHWGYRAFRWAELLTDPSLDLRDSVVGVELAMPWSESDSAFVSSSPDLDRVWGLCRYSLRALRLDVYQDTPSRERGPYEGDAVVDELSEHSVQRSYSLSRYSVGYLARRPTWPTEYRMQMPIVAWRDYMDTGDPGVLTDNYDALLERLRLDRLNAQGLVEKEPGPPSATESDLVDWPITNRDGYVFTRVNTVINAWQFACLVAMADIARVIGHREDSLRFSSLAARLRDSLNAACLRSDGTYVDGIGTDHRSQHATAYAVALGIIPDSYLAAAGRALAAQGMRMSANGAQFLLEALYRSGQPEAAMALMTSHGEYSWLRMMDDFHATIAMEAWSPALKPNTTFSHTWGTAPANIIPRYVAGVRIVEPGAARLQIRPQPSDLSFFRATVPTIRGSVEVRYDGRGPARLFQIELPPNVPADIELAPALVDLRRAHVSGGTPERFAKNGGLLVKVPAGGRISIAG
jgi:alpha-L-rhamnosidase